MPSASDFFRFVPLALLALLRSNPAGAAEIRVFSELARIGLNGEVIAPDRGVGAKPREILSPAVARNAFASFHVFVDAKPTEKWTLYVGQNPDKALGVTLYREIFADGRPEVLEAVTQPLEGSGAAVVWMDLWVDRNAAVQRVKIEPELQVEGVKDWITYPMEVRVLSAVAPSAGEVRVAAAGTGSDAVGLANLAGWLCKTPVAGTSAVARSEAATVRGLIARNAAQDYAMLQNSGDADWFWMATKATDRKAWCKSPARPAGASTEWYLRIRDRLIRQ